MSLIPSESQSTQQQADRKAAQDALDKRLNLDPLFPYTVIQFPIEDFGLTDPMPIDTDPVKR